MDEDRQGYEGADGDAFDIGNLAGKNLHGGDDLLPPGGVAGMSQPQQADLLIVSARRAAGA
jgi:hypothetical protein